jgi:hypothetical protein
MCQDPVCYPPGGHASGNRQLCAAWPRSLRHRRMAGYYRPRMMNENEHCLHDQPPRPGPTEPLIEGSTEEGVVVCVHMFGLGLYLPVVRAFGHMDAPFMGVDASRGFDTYPPVGSHLTVAVFGYSGSGQLRLGAAS